MSSPRSFPTGRLLLPAACVIAVALLWWLRPGPAIAPPVGSAPLTIATAPAAAPLTPLPPTRPTSPSDTTNQRTDAAPRAPQLVGRLVQRGLPLPNVPLRLYIHADSVPTATDHTVTTGADGSFATAGLAQPFWLAAECESVPAEWRSPTFATLQGDQDLGDLEPPPAMTLDVQVVDDAGQPVPRPRFWVARSDVHVALDRRDARAPRCVHGDANGRVRLDRLHPGTLYLKVDAEGRAMARKQFDLDPERPPEPVHWRLPRGGWLEGRVFDWRDRPLAGAVVGCEGQRTTTDAAGAFVLRPYGGVEAVHIEALGHQPMWVGSTWSPDVSHIRLQRAVVLRGVVHGGNGATSIVLAPAWEKEQGLPWPGPNDRIARPLPVAADGTFVIEGLEASNYTVHARAEGLGATASQMVKLRDDTAIELTIEPSASMALRVVDAEGRPVAPLEVACSLAVLEYPSLFGPHGKDIPDRLFHGTGRVDLPTHGERTRIAVPPNEPFALGVRSEGFLPEVRSFAAGAAPPELTIVLSRGGAVRGVLRGGSSVAHLRHIAIWASEQEAMDPARRTEARQLAIDAQGRFASGTLPPGDYRAAVHRYGRARIGHRGHEQLGAVPLVDEDEDMRSVVPFAVVGGATTTIELTDPPLGTLRGYVRQAGRAVAGAWVVAARPGARLFEHVAGGGQAIDWNDATDLQYVAGQRSGADGSFVFLYRDAGPLELRVRHADGAGTMPPVLVDLPPPGQDVFRDLELALGGVRGRFVAAATGGSGARAAAAVLFPIDRAAADPFFTTDWQASVAFTCTRCELGADGGFVFAHVPNGEWVVRIGDGFHSSYTHRVVVVDGSEVDLGELRTAARGDTKLAWHWRPGTSARQIQGLWLYEERNGRPAIWVGTFDAHGAGAACALAAGNYLGVVFGRLGAEEQFVFRGTFGEPTGSALSEPFVVEVRGDGTTVPAQIELLPAVEPR